MAVKISALLLGRATPAEGSRPRAPGGSAAAIGQETQRALTSTAEREETMGLWFQNGYTDPVYIALLWYDPGCSPEPGERAAGMRWRRVRRSKSWARICDRFRI